MRIIFTKFMPFIWSFLMSVIKNGILGGGLLDCRSLVNGGGASVRTGPCQSGKFLPGLSVLPVHLFNRTDCN